jgi:hypothetical protein
MTDAAWQNKEPDFKNNTSQKYHSQLVLAGIDRLLRARRNGHCNGTGRAMIRVEQFARMARSCLL